MSDSEPTRMMGLADAPVSDRTLVAGFGATQQMPAGGAGDAFRTQMGGVATCPVCQSTTPLLETYCGECGFLLASTPAESVELPVEEAPLAELVDVADGRRYRLRAGVNTIGRQGTDLIVNEGTISRVHARVTIEAETGAIFVEDLGSTNGTKVGDRRLTPNQPMMALTGMALRFGNWRVLLEGAALPAAGSGAGEPTIAISTAIPDRTLVGASGEALAGMRPAAATVTPAPSVANAPEPDGPPFARLRKIEGPAADIAIGEGVITLGRKSVNAIVLTQDSYISGRHAEIHTDATGTFLTDLGSTNGSLVNGQRLEAQEPQLLLEGDEIQLGQTKYVFEFLDIEVEPEDQVRNGTAATLGDAPAHPAAGVANAAADLPHPGPDVYAEGAGLPSDEGGDAVLAAPSADSPTFTAPADAPPGASSVLPSPTPSETSKTPHAE